MSEVARYWWVPLFLFLVVGCGNSGEELGGLKQATSGLTSQVAELKTTVGVLQDSVTRLNDQGQKRAGDYKSLSETVEILKDRNEQYEGQHSNLADAVSRLEQSYKLLTKKVAEAVATVAKSHTDTEGRAPVTSYGSAKGLQGDRSKVDGLRLTAPNAEVCEAIEKYTKQIESLMRQSPSSSTQSKMDEALAHFKETVNRFPDQKNAILVWRLAEDLKWTAYNATKARSYLAESGEGMEWKQLVREHESKLRRLCGQ